MTEESSARPVVGVDVSDEPLAAARFVLDEGPANRSDKEPDVVVRDRLARALLAASVTARRLVGNCPRRSSGSTTHGLHRVSDPVAAVPVVTGAGR